MDHGTSVNKVGGVWRGLDLRGVNRLKQRKSKKLRDVKGRWKRKVESKKYQYFTRISPVWCQELPEGTIVFLYSYQNTRTAMEEFAQADRQDQ